MAESAHSIDVTQQNFQHVVIDGSAQRPVLVDFWAGWCQPCQMLMPILAKLAQSYAGKFLLAKVNTDQEQHLAAQYGIRSLPTVVLFRNGKPVDQFMGVQPESGIRALLDKHLPRPSDATRQQALQALQHGNADAAVLLLQQALEADPDNQALKIDLAQALLALRHFDEAEHALNTLPMDLHQQESVKRLEAHLRLARVAPADATQAQALQQRLQSEPNDPQALQQLGAYYTLHEDYAQALALFLQLMRSHRRYGDDAGHKGLLAIFEMLGARHPLVNEYRRKMVSLLY